MKYYISPPPASPLARIIASLFAAVAIVLAIVFGLFVLAAAVGLGLLAWLGLVIRAWWLRRKGVAAPGKSRPGDSGVIEAEYKVVSRRRD